MLDIYLKKYADKNNGIISIDSINEILKMNYDAFRLVNEKYNESCDYCKESWMVKQLNCKYKLYKKPFEFRSLYLELQKFSELHKKEDYYKAKIEKFKSIKNDGILFEIWINKEIDDELDTGFLEELHLYSLKFDGKNPKQIRGLKINHKDLQLTIFWKDFIHLLNYYSIIKKYIGLNYFDFKE